MAYSSASCCRLVDPCDPRVESGGPGPEAPPSGEAPGPLVYRHFIWFDLKRNQGNALLTEGLTLLRDETFVVGRFERRPQSLQALFKFRKLMAEVRSAIAATLTLYVAVSTIVQVQVAAADSVLVEIDTVDLAHIHEACAFRPAEHSLQRFPVRLHISSIFLLTAAPVFAAHSAGDTFGLTRS